MDHAWRRHPHLRIARRGMHRVWRTEFNGLEAQPQHHRHRAGAWHAICRHRPGRARPRRRGRHRERGQRRNRVVERRRIRHRRVRRFTKSANFARPTGPNRTAGVHGGRVGERRIRVARRRTIRACDRPEHMAGPLHERRASQGHRFSVAEPGRVRGFRHVVAGRMWRHIRIHALEQRTAGAGHAHRLRHQDPERGPQHALDAPTRA